MFSLKAIPPPEHEDTSIVRVKTSTWISDKGIISLRKDIIPIKRKSKGYQILQEDAANIGVLEVVDKIVNLDEISDGLYEIITVNEFRDWESGYIEDYDYKLIPFDNK